MNNYNSLANDRQSMDEANASGSMHTSFTRFKRQGAGALLVALCLFAASGCSSNYVIHTVDGKAYNTQGAPELTNGGYSFTDAQGEHRELMLSQVSQVVKP
ncbi:YgdI/YgdR family lipoprotein [Pseudomonas sp. dw_358]|uniref:YgdI/YgdR family lipoprotein n=1 Tax=Pseudomonas sp. dw_358 TaxID=2720083 RepID=UPI001BD6729C|nr:YgdI/YgdR family lipoprotein [Pseudomonas sp. dw_358]